jgi:signal transduction histidine kinase
VQRTRWQLPILLPALLAGALVSAIALQSVRAVQVHRRAVDGALHDYAAFATWQYARRASDYLRLTIVTMLPAAAASHGSIVCTVRDGHVTVASNETTVPDAAIAAALEDGVSRMNHSYTRIGLVPLGNPRDQRFLGYWFKRDSTGDWGRCDAMIVADAQLVATLNHVAGFAPLLPPSVVGPLPRDSLVSIRVLAPNGAPIAAIGGSFAGIAASDTLGPDLAGLRVVATLHPSAVRRLVAGGMPASNAPALVAMLAVALLLAVLAVVQLRRSQQVIRMRSDFVASVSHELKTPLAQISLFADTLALPRERGADERRQYLTIISRESKRLGQLVDNILHFANMARPDISPATREPALLGEEIREAVTAFQPIANARSVTIRVALAGEIEVPLDRDAFRQLLLNVLDNALKFGPDGGGIVVTAEYVDGRARVRIDDAGPGVPASERERMFEAFARADRGGSRGGSGIGLAVVKDVVDRHAGSVRLLESPLGGARIEVEFPDAAVVTSERLAEMAPA